jgi:hypothetical protein
MRPFIVAQIAGIAFNVGLFQSDFACAYVFRARSSLKGIQTI